MKKTINFYEFERGFVERNRKESFTYEGLRLIFDYMEDLEEDLGTEFEFDPIALCCEFTEFESIQEVLDAYSIQETDPTIDTLQEYFSVVLVGENGIIVVSE
jgi:hypothetical protein